MYFVQLALLLGLAACVLIDQRSARRAGEAKDLHRQIHYSMRAVVSAILFAAGGIAFVLYQT